MQKHLTFVTTLAGLPVYRNDCGRCEVHCTKYFVNVFTTWADVEQFCAACAATK